MKRKIFTNKFYLFLELIIISISALLIMKSEDVQKIISPKSYWTFKIKEIESNILCHNWEIQSLELALDKERAVGHFDIQKAKCDTSFGKGNQEDLIENAIAVHLEKISELENQLKESETKLKIKEEKLVQAITKAESVDFSK
jgi:hypothetical protein